MSKPVMTIDKMVRADKLTPPQMTARFTPTDDPFVLAHMGIPAVAAPDWSLTIDGLVEKPLTLTYEELLKRPKRVIESSKITTSRLCSTRRFAFSMTISDTAT